MKIIVISGKAQHGKDTTAGFMKEFLEARGKRVLITHYGDLVKYICKTFFGWNGEKDEAGRTILQRVGTDVIRAQKPNYWVRFVQEILDMFPDEWDYVLIPDCRFPNEITYMKPSPLMPNRPDVTHIRVYRENFASPLTEEQQKHISETALDDCEPDIRLINRGTLEDLREAVETIVDDMEMGINTKLVATVMRGEDICYPMTVTGG